MTLSVGSVVMLAALGLRTTTAFGHTDSLFATLPGGASSTPNAFRQGPDHAEVADVKNLDLEFGLETSWASLAHSYNLSDTSLDEYNAFADRYIESVEAKPEILLAGAFSCGRPVGHAQESHRGSEHVVVGGGADGGADPHLAFHVRAI